MRVYEAAEIIKTVQFEYFIASIKAILYDMQISSTIHFWKIRIKLAIALIVYINANCFLIFVCASLMTAIWTLLLCFDGAVEEAQI